MRQHQQNFKLIDVLKPNKMGYIKEPKGVDFLIKSPPLPDKERKEIGEFIKDEKIQNSDEKTNAE